MARPLRIELPGAVYHVTARGNGRRTIFPADRDCEAFLQILEHVAWRQHWRCHAFCLMGNHYHLVVETERPTLSAGMRSLNGVFAQGHNRRHGRTGHVFQGRFHAVLVQKESHLLEVARYVVLNPCRAGLCRAPEEWRWSSYRATAGLEAAPRFLDLRWLLGQFAPTPARERYREFVADGLGRDPWQSLRGGIYLGDPDFAETRAPGRREQAEIPEAQQQPVRPTLGELLDEHGERGVLIAYREHGYRLRELAEGFECHYSTVSRRIRTLEAEDRHGRDAGGQGVRHCKSEQARPAYVEDFS